MLYFRAIFVNLTKSVLVFWVNWKQSMLIWQKTTCAMFNINFVFFDKYCANLVYKKVGQNILKTNTVHSSGLRGCKSASADTNHPNDTSRKQEDSPLRIALADKTANSMLANPLLMASLNRWLHLWSFKAFCFWK